MRSVAAQQASSPAQGDFLSDLLSSSYVRHAPGTGDMRHDTEGWRCLETSFKVSALFSGCSGQAAKTIMVDRGCKELPPAFDTAP